MVWHGDATLPDVDLIVVPGGFSYGDYLRSGAMAAQSPVMRDVVAKAQKGVPVLGICNGFQVLTECGLLPGVLMRNANLKFVCKDIYLRTEAADTMFTDGYEEGQVIRIPVAHHDGNYFADDDTLARLQDELGLSYMFITHDLATVRAIADEVVVMKDGRVIEQGPKTQMFTPPHHPYTDLLLSSVPEMDPDWLSDLLAERGVDNLGDAAVDKM